MTRDEGPPAAIGLTGHQGPYDTDDAEIVRNFPGKSRADFAGMLRSRKGFTTEDFMWMAGLRYYLPEVQAFLRSVASEGGWEFAHGLITSLHFQFDRHLKSLTKDIAGDVSDQRTNFGIDPEDPESNRYLREMLE